MGRLRGALQSKYKDRDEDFKVHTPRNLETLNLTFRGERIAKVRTIGLFLWKESQCHALTGHWNIGGRASRTELSPVGTSSCQRLLIYLARP
jgi:hypothetical protein